MSDISIAETENQSTMKSLSGKELPLDWPHIITLDEENKVYRDTLQSEDDSQIDKLSYTLKRDNKEVKYLAVQHIAGIENRSHRQFQALKENFDQMRPDIVLYEGPQANPISLTEDQSFQYGEKGYMQYLVLDNNSKLQPGQKPIEMQSADMSDSEMVAEFRKKGYTNEEIATFDLLRIVYSISSGIKNSPGLTPDQKKLKLASELQEITTDYEGYLRQRNFPEFLPLVPRTDGQKWNTELIKQEIQRLTGQELNMDLDAREIPIFQKMFEDQREFRDKIIVRKINQALQTHAKVMVVMGSGHAIRERAALEELFS